MAVNILGAASAEMGREVEFRNKSVDRILVSGRDYCFEHRLASSFLISSSGIPRPASSWAMPSSIATSVCASASSVKSSTGDAWVGAFNPSATFSPLVLAPGHLGTIEVTFNGWPLYTWAEDTHPGEATGQALNNNGGLWYVLGAGGQQITTGFTVTPSPNGNSGG